MPNSKLGLDIHGVIDNNPGFFSDLTHMLKDIVEVHIITGGRYLEEIEDLKKWNIHFDKFFSIYDYHEVLGNKPLYNEKGNMRMPETQWDSTKGIYCKENEISVMIDDTYRYKQYMPESTYFYHYK